MKRHVILSRPIFWVALVSVCFLSIPLVAMQFTDEVNWSTTDFIVMGMLIFGMAFLYVLLTRSASKIIHRGAVVMAVGSTFLLIWVNLAVGLIGSGPNTANLMYIGVIVIIVIGALLSGFTTKGMERTMFSVAIALVLVAIIQLLAKMNQYPGSSIIEVIGVNSFFAMLFAVSGLLFRYTTLKHSPATA